MLLSQRSGPPALWQAMTRKEAHMAAHCSQVRLSSSACTCGQPLAMHQVVSVHTGHKAPAAVCEPGVQGGNESLMRRRTTVKRESWVANQRAYANESSSEPSSTSTHCQRCSVCRCRLRRQAGNVAAAFQTGNSMEMSGGNVGVPQVYSYI